MRIASSQISTNATHAVWSMRTRQERLEIWTGDGRDRQVVERMDGAGALELSVVQTLADRLQADRLAARSPAQPPAPASGTPVEPELSPRDEQILRILEITFGLKIERTSLHFTTAAAEAAAEAPAQPPGGLRYDWVEQQVDGESMAFNAKGQVQTADGRQISFNLDVAMAHVTVQTQELHLRLGQAAVDPLALDLDGNGIGLDAQVSWSIDLDGDGIPDQVAAPAGGDAFLAFDRNGNGAIDQRGELFGPTSGDGFAELATLDQDGDGWLDEDDAAWSSLILFKPGAENQTLVQAGVGAISLAAIGTPFRVADAANATLGQIRASAAYLREDGQAGVVQQVDLVV